MDASCALGVLIYSEYAELCHLPSILMVASGIPQAAAVHCLCGGPNISVRGDQSFWGTCPYMTDWCPTPVPAGVVGLEKGWGWPAGR